MSKKNKFPKTLLVTLDPMNGGDDILIAHGDNVDNIPEEHHNDHIAIYALVEVKRFNVKKGIK